MIARPEENLAKRLIWRHNLKPPIDIRELAERYAIVEVVNFPVDVDGVSLHLKVKGRRPTILLSSSITEKRSRFTLAHELGHVLIPWHLGSIVDETDLAGAAERSAYWELEAEANRFASELLIPSLWTTQISSEMIDPAKATKYIIAQANVSIQATTIKLLQVLPKGYAFARVSGGRINWSSLTAGTLASRLPYEVVDIDTVYASASSHSWLAGSDGIYHWWRIADAIELPKGHESDVWRDLLSSILSDLAIDDPKIQMSINGVISAAHGSIRTERSPERLFAICLNRFEAKGPEDKLGGVIRHSLFLRFLSARVRSFFE